MNISNGTKNVISDLEIAVQFENKHSRNSILLECDLGQQIEGGIVNRIVHVLL